MEVNDNTLLDMNVVSTDNVISLVMMSLIYVSMVFQELERKLETQSKHAHWETQ